MKNCIILLALALSCDGQIADFLFPQVSKASRNVVDELSNNPILSFTTKASGELLAAAVAAIASGPEAVARTLGLGTGLPAIINDKNIRGAADRYVADFSSGLGNEDARLPLTSLVPKYGYPVEQHAVTTTDGYVLTVHRIPGNGSTVFLMHGLLGSSDDYFLNGPVNGLGYILANKGYDVWLGNARGNKYSRMHTTLQPSEATFWDFSWHEIGYYDLPAMIDYALKETNQKSLTYIGHSQGTTTFFVMTSLRPEYNEKITLMIALSPIAYMSKVRSPIVRLLAPGTSILHGFAKMFGIYEFHPDDNATRLMKMLMCGTGPISEIVCTNIIFLVAGFDFPQMNFTNLPVILGHLPSGAAAKQFVHYGQEVISGKFQQFDNGAAGNMERYGSEVPPSYPLEKITAPVALFYSDADWLAHPEDVEILYKRLSNVVDMHKIPYDQFNHLDFLLAKDFKSLVYKRIRKLIKHYSGRS